MTVSSSPRELLLLFALRNQLIESNLEAGFARFSAMSRQSLSYESFCDAVASCLRDRLIHEPVRLLEHALQCHWRLELTPQGVAAARRLLAGQPV